MLTISITQFVRSGRSSDNQRHCFHTRDPTGNDIAAVNTAASNLTTRNRLKCHQSKVLDCIL